MSSYIPQSKKTVSELNHSDEFNFHVYAGDLLMHDAVNLKGENNVE